MRRTFLLVVFLIAAATLSAAQDVTVLYSFCSQASCADGSAPYAGLVQGSDGNFYGTTLTGGANGVGTIFKIAPQGTLTVLYNFCSQPSCSDGSLPYGSLVEASDGSFYGTTFNGGAQDSGTVFRFTAQGTLTTLYSFCSLANCADGWAPYAGLVQGNDENFYGTSFSGGEGYGTVFKISQQGILTSLHTFKANEGNFPYAGLIQGSDGNFFGTTVAGAYGAGTVFKVSPTGTYDTLHAFLGAEGYVPYAGLVQGTDGNLYGSTSGSVGGSGTVFNIATSGGTLNELHTFNGADGATPYAALVQARDGFFYGSTHDGGDHNQGTVYKIDANGTLTSLYSFDGSAGANPVGALVQGADGRLYGTTIKGGTAGAGTVFAISLSSTSLDVTKNGAGLVSSTDRHIYCGDLCFYAYNEGAQVTLSAVPAPGYTFSGWSGCDNVNASYCYVTITSSKNVTATFDPVGNITLTSLTFNPSHVRGGQLSAGTLTLNAPAPPGGVGVALSSDHPGAAHPPSFVLVPGGQSSVGFAVNTFPVKGNTTVTITATAGNSQVNGTLIVGTTSLPQSLK